MAQRMKRNLALFVVMLASATVHADSKRYVENLVRENVKAVAADKTEDFLWTVNDDRVLVLPGGTRDIEKALRDEISTRPCSTTSSTS